MPEKKRYNFRKILANTVWTALGTGVIVLLVAAINKKNGDHCKAVSISIQGVKNNLFIDKADVTLMLEKLNLGKLPGKPLNDFDLAAMEARLKKNEWIKNAELFFDNNDMLKINIVEREPIARIFNSAGHSFYIDSAITRVPLSDKFSARLPVFTNFPVTNSLSKTDSNLLTDIKNISLYISNDPFCMAQIEQVDITAEKTFEMIPKIGNQVIVFGPADNYTEKFKNLLIFYRNVESKVGWNKYAILNVTYKDQVVAIKRGANDIKMDSLKTIELMKQLIANAVKEANDSINNIQLVQPKDDNSVPVAQPQDNKLPEEKVIINQPGNMPTAPIKSATGGQKPLLQQENNITDNSIKNNNPKSQPPKSKSNFFEKPNPVPLKTTPTIPVIKKAEVTPKKQPKAIMQPKNDY